MFGFFAKAKSREIKTQTSAFQDRLDAVSKMFEDEDVLKTAAQMQYDAGQRVARAMWSVIPREAVEHYGDPYCIKLWENAHRPGNRNLFEGVSSGEYLQSRLYAESKRARKKAIA